MTEKKKEILVCLFTGLASILTFCIITHIWNMDLTIPFVYGGDLSGLLINIKSILREESWWNFTGLGAPFHTNMWRQMMDGCIPNGIIYLIAKITQSAGCGINLYYIISYGLSGMCAYYMLRKSGIRQIFSITGSILYATIPGHFFRGESHIYIGSCFSLPLIIITATNLYEGRMCKSKYTSTFKLSAKELLNSNSKEQNWGLFFYIIVSFSSTYYGIFSLMLLTFCAVSCSITHKQARHLYYYLQYVLAELICIFLIYIPSILANTFDPCIEKVDIITRSLGDVETFAGKLIQYILPISEHRISFLSELRQLYNTSFPLINENGASSLGFIMSFGFIFGILICFFHKEKISIELEIYGKIELFLLLVSTVGGLGAIVGMINYSLRCYNRFSFLIGAVGVIISMKLLQKFCLWISSAVVSRHLQQIIPCTISILVLIIGILDQTTVSMAYTKEYGENIKSHFNDDAHFVQNIELYEGANANILVFPVLNAQQASMGQSDGLNMGGNEYILPIHSNTLNFSQCSKPGEYGERWINWIQTLDTKTQIKLAAIVGFSGIAIYYGGYQPETLNTMLTTLEEMLGKPIAINGNGSWAYYSISNVHSKLLSEYTEDEILCLKDKYLNNFTSVRLYNYSNLFTTSEYTPNGKILLSQNSCQYGPYNSYAAGQYTVEIFGKNLDKAHFDCSSRENMFEIDITENKDEYVKYYVRFKEDTDDIEFRTFNTSEWEITINRIEVTKLNE